MGLWQQIQKSMKTTKYIIGVVLATMLIACSNDYENYVPEVEAPEEPTEAIYFTEDELLVLMQMRNPDNRICIDEATEIALDALDFFDGEINTRSGQARTIADVTALRGEPATRLTTRSANGSDIEIQMPDTVAFVFNFADDAGFTIVPADTRISSSILAFVKDGNLDLNEELNHPGLEIFFSGLEEYIEWSIIEAEQRRDSLMAGILEKIAAARVKNNPDLDDAETRWTTGPEIPYQGLRIRFDTSYGPWSTIRRIGPLLPVEWHQNFPFNYRLKMCSGRADGRAPAGCVAVAIAHIMAHWKYPRRVGLHLIDWELLNEFTARPNAYENVMEKRPLPAFGTTFPDNDRRTLFRNDVALLMHVIGSGVNMTYTCDGSFVPSIFIQRMIDFLHRMGYTGGSRENFSTTAVINSLALNRPVIARGYRDQTLGFNHNGHVWVIDGHLTRRRQVTITVTEYIDFISHQIIISVTPQNHHEEVVLLHNNWGWAGQGNGYFWAGTFHVGRRIYASDTRGSVPLHERNYRFGNRIYPNIRPR